ncbi:tyrosine-type recombinase/integrase [Nocardioides sp. WS12]|uniref:site-specific integrase n=1 Tax=Nocardioides sp. WS12 TaxID=2486272 RepID=UPI0015FD88DE|nr:tyrosine-type recombinase/integrase [Nocardioides sp. WS12]
MPQIRIPRGGHGDIVAKQLADGRWSARVQVRDIDGRVRSVRATEKTKSSATRLVERRLRERVDPSIAGITGDTTFEDLSALWLQHRKDHGKVKTKGLLAPQTLATYQYDITQVIIPAIGQVRVREATIPLLDRLFADVEHGRKHGNYPARPGGRSTRQLRVVLGGMLALAVAHGALTANPIRDVSQSSRQPNPEVKFLTIDQARHLRTRVRRTAIRVPDQRMPNHDLEEFIDLLLGTGCREGEGLAIRPIDLHDLDGPVPTVHICGTVIEPRKGYVDHLHRQNRTKTGDDRRLVLPDAVAAMLRERMRRDPPSTPESPIFATGTGNWISPANLRTRLRSALSRSSGPPDPFDEALAGTTLHTLRRTVGTLIAHEVSLDAARDQLGHRDPSVTFRHYVGKRLVAPDLRSTLDQFFV